MPFNFQVEEIPDFLQIPAAVLKHIDNIIIEELLQPSNIPYCSLQRRNIRRKIFEGIEDKSNFDSIYRRLTIGRISDLSIFEKFHPYIFIFLKRIVKNYRKYFRFHKDLEKNTLLGQNIKRISQYLKFNKERET
jgi:hypothetical protein